MRAVVTRLRGLGEMLSGSRKDAVERRAAKLRREAVAWLSLLSSGTATTADAEALKRWCSEDSAHARAYAEAARAWDMLAPVARHAQIAERHGLRQPPPLHRGVGRRALLGGALAASAAGMAYAVVNPPLSLWPSLAELRADVRTGTGEQRRIEISNGVAVDLNTRSSLAWGGTLSEGGNHIELIAGEAVVAAGPAPVDTCVVTAGMGRVIAHDARVDIRHDAGRIRVVCLGGNVRVEHRAQAVMLPAGQRVVYDDLNISALGTVDPQIVTAWQRGRLVFQKELLARVVDEVNRYRPGRIILMDRDLGRHLIDASFSLDRLDNVITYIRQAFDARITVLPGGLVLVG
jgi:transmembrane sensor